MLAAATATAALAWGSLGAGSAAGVLMRAPTRLVAVSPEPRWEPARLLDDVEEFLRRFIAHPSEHARVAHVLWIAHTHAMEKWESTPRIVFLSPEPGSGKSRALEVTELLVPRPVHAVNTTPAYLFRKVAEDGGLPTILFDEIDTVFGPRAKENEDIRGLLNAGHRKGAVAGRCVVRGKDVFTEELQAYCAVALAGLDDLPDTLMSRSVVVRMRRRAPNEVVEPFRHRDARKAGSVLRDALDRWAGEIPAGVWPDMPDGIEDRNADVWEALLAVADAAGGDWPKRARCAAVTLVTAANAAIPSMGVRLLADLHSVFSEHDHADHLFTDDIISSLVAMDDAPWADIRGKAVDARSLARHLARYEIKPRTVRIGERTSKGYARSDLIDPWTRYVSVVTVLESDDVGTSTKGNVTTVTTSQPPLGLDGSPSAQITRRGRRDGAEEHHSRQQVQGSPAARGASSRHSPAEGRGPGPAAQAAAAGWWTVRRGWPAITHPPIGTPATRSSRPGCCQPAIQHGERASKHPEPVSQRGRAVGMASHVPVFPPCRWRFFPEMPRRSHANPT